MTFNIDSSFIETYNKIQKTEFTTAKEIINHCYYIKSINRKGRADQTRASEILGISIITFRNLMRKHNIPVERKTGLNKWLPFLEKIGKEKISTMIIDEVASELKLSISHTCKVMREHGFKCKKATYGSRQINV